MFENKSSLVIPAAIIIGAMLLGGLFWLVAGRSTFKMAIVNTGNLINQSEFGRGLTKELQEKNTELGKKAEAAKTDDEKQKISKEFAAFQTEKEAEFAKKVTEAVAAVAKRKGVGIVASSQSFIYSQIDLTDEVIKELDK